VWAAAVVTIIAQTIAYNNKYDSLLAFTDGLASSCSYLGLRADKFIAKLSKQA